ncbi:DNA-binding transcriptional regulator, MarR family [Anaeromicropila populeti]|uniref:DNA-binding transcriptional regulator, MarR family n=1 Tax=Anaeromicropila populeti TaxID=37658 RepID=A0A1I6HYE8_9FIRM|nr:DNA-binding transcriptional regulator, MarR family [Anaeromicropila populeti]
MQITSNEFENEIIQYVEKIKELVSLEMWQNILLDCSKNELFILWLLYRSKEVNMTQIAEYIKVPLNTATGIMNRMEKKNLVIRQRSKEDKRIVTICLSEMGENQIQDIMTKAMYYGARLVGDFTSEEINLLLRIMNKLIDIMKEEASKEISKKKIRKISID